MPLELLLAMATFAAVTAVTPGPNNAMLMASGLNFGWRRTLPHLLGVGLGFGFMVLAVGAGVGQIFVAWPGLFSVLRALAVAYLVWLAWGIATSGGVPEPEAGARPMSFAEAAAFQWVNPKAWIMAIGATTTYVFPGGPWASSAVNALVFMVVGLFASGAWVVFGAALGAMLANPRAVRAVNVVLAMLLVLSLAPVAADLWSEVVVMRAFGRAG